MSTAPDPAVSILVPTYNHASYIERAVRSVVRQQTTFPYEIIIGDDCSVDGTRDIVRNLCDQSPAEIRLILPDLNQGAFGNAIFRLMIDLARGQYLALIDGDDYWIARDKLQRQVELLQIAPDCSLVFHNAYNLQPDGKIDDYVRSFNIEIKERYSVEDILFQNFIPGSSIVARADAVRDLPAELEAAPAGDWIFNVVCALRGDLAYIDERWSVRRVHPGGLFSGKTYEERLKLDIGSMRAINAYIRNSHDDALYRRRASNHLRLMTMLLEQGAYRAALAHAWTWVSMSAPHGGLFSLKTLTRAIALIGRIAASEASRIARRANFGTARRRGRRHERHPTRK